MPGLQNVFAVGPSLQYFSVFWRKQGNPEFLLISWQSLVMDETGVIHIV